MQPESLLGSVINRYFRPCCITSRLPFSSWRERFAGCSGGAQYMLKQQDNHA